MTLANETTVGGELAGFGAALTLANIPDAVVEKIRCNLLHNTACALAAHAAGAPLWAVAKAGRGEDATVYCDGARVPAEHAAFANGALMHTRAQDDTHMAARTHVGSCVLPAALALAEREGRDGTALVTAAAAGCEIAAAIGERLASRVTARGFRATPVFGTIGAAAAAASLLGLDREAAAHAIAIGASFSAGTNQTWIDGSSEYRIQPGMAARNGIVAADLAAAGFTGAAHWYEGAAGFAGAFADGDPHAGEPWLLGERWRLLEVVYKPFPVCAITQSPVRVAIDMATDSDLSVDDVVGVQVFLNPADHTYPGTVNPGPYNDIAATLMSAEYCVAMALTQRSATLEGLRGFDDPTLMRLVAATDVIADPAVPQLGGRVRVRLADQRELAGELIPDASTYGWDWDGVVANAERMLPEMAIGAEQLASVIAAIAALPDGADAGEIARRTVS
jgi:2-methylcitrate dehydratase PrpD